MENNPAMRTTPVLLAALVVSLPVPAHAYVDPGTGAMLLQLLLGGVAGAAVVAKLYWARLRSLFKKSKVDDGEAPPADRER
jgi:hypothetical protein